MPFPTIEIIRTERLDIRPVCAADLAALLDVNGDDEVTRFLPYASWRGLADAEAWFTRMEALAASGTGQQLVMLRRHDSLVIGTLLLFRFDESASRLELGYVVGRRHWRQGLAREALSALLAHVFGPMAIRRVEAEVNPANLGSNALLRSLGFKHEGLLRQRWVAKGTAYDVNAYGMLTGEWCTDQAGPVVGAPVGC